MGHASGILAVLPLVLIWQVSWSRSDPQEWLHRIVEGEHVMSTSLERLLGMLVVGLALLLAILGQPTNLSMGEAEVAHPRKA